MRLSFFIAIPAVRSWFAELRYRIRAGHVCPFCDLPMICFAAASYLGRSCFLHKFHVPRRESFLEGSAPEAPCNCPHCVQVRSQRRAA